MSELIINGTHLELNLLDADVMEKYEKFNEEIVEKMNEPTQYEGISAADCMRKQCRYVDEFFDKLFGDGTAAELFSGGNDLGLRMDAFAQVSAAGQSAHKELTSISDKYSASRIQNRDPHRKKIQRGKKHNWR